MAAHLKLPSPSESDPSTITNDLYKCLESGGLALQNISEDYMWRPSRFVSSRHVKLFYKDRTHYLFFSLSRALGKYEKEIMVSKLCL